MNQKILKHQDIYRTFDLVLAATLSLWYPLEGIDKTNLQRSEFIFKRDDNLDQLIELFWRGALKVEPKMYFNQLKAIKSRIYARE
jgi:hypothetical protein